MWCKSSIGIEVAAKKRYEFVKIGFDKPTKSAMVHNNFYICTGASGVRLYPALHQHNN